MTGCDPFVTEDECPTCSAAAANENEREPMSNNKPEQTMAEPKDARTPADAARDRRAAAPDEPRDRRGQDKSTT
jgi:hypothetical protein